MAKIKEIRNSTAEFLIFQIEGKEQGIEVYYKDENVWATVNRTCNSTTYHRVVTDSEESHHLNVCWN